MVRSTRFPCFPQRSPGPVHRRWGDGSIVLPVGRVVPFVVTLVRGRLRMVATLGDGRDVFFRWHVAGEPAGLISAVSDLPLPVEQNPLHKTDKGHAFDERLGTQWGNSSTDPNDPSRHFELMGHITGHLELRGRRYEIDCYDCVDHSWSRRTETSKRAVSWISAVFGEDYGIHMAVLLDVRDGKTVYEGLRNGYVMEDGAVHGLVSATVEGHGVKFNPMNVHIVATDVRGKQHEEFGAAIAVHPWYNYNRRTWPSSR